MAVGLVMRFDGVGSRAYDDVMAALGLPLHEDGGGNWPVGIISHAAGAQPDGGWTVVDVWESQEAFDAFFAARLGPALASVDDMPEPQVMPFTVHNAFRHGTEAQGD